MRTEKPLNFFSWDEVPEDYTTASQWPRHGRKVREKQTPAARVVTPATFKKGERFVSEARILEDDGDTITIITDEIPLYHESQTRPYTARDRTLDYFHYEDIFYTYCRKDRFIYWQETPPDDPPKGWEPGWRNHPSVRTLDPNRRLSPADVRAHLNHTRLYGVVAGAWTRFVMIDLDLHEGDRGVFLDQLKLLLGRFWGHGGWHLEAKTDGIGGVHLIRAFPDRRRTADQVSKLKARLIDVDRQHPELARRAVEAGMPSFADLEVYPQETGNGVRLPLGRGRTVLLDCPLGTVTHRGKTLPDLHAYLRWMHDPNRTYMTADDVIEYVQTRLATALPKLKAEAVHPVKGDVRSIDSVKVFGPLKGRFRQVLIEFFTGKLAPHGSLNAGIVLGARALWLEQVGEDAAADILGHYVRDLPDLGVSGRLERGEFDEIDRVIRNTVRSVYRDNGGQGDSDFSSALLARTAEAWRRAGFRFSDKSSWATSNSVTETPKPVTFTAELRHRIARPMADALKVSDPELAVEVAEYVVGVVAARQQSGSGLSMAYYKKVIEQEFGIPCGAHGKVNCIVKVMCGLGLIRRVASHQFSTAKGKGLAARYEVGSAVVAVDCK
jgi:hypothetical protein